MSKQITIAAYCLSFSRLQKSWFSPYSLSFPRRRESSLCKVFWTPACAGVTNGLCFSAACCIHPGPCAFRPPQASPGATYCLLHTV